MTCISLITQNSIYDIFGEAGCFVFKTSVRILMQLLAISGFGMAIFRIICVENLVKQISRANLVKITLLIEIVFIICTNIVLNFSIKTSGWENLNLYQFCMDYGSMRGDILHSYNDYENKELGKKNKSIKFMSLSVYLFTNFQLAYYLLASFRE